MIENLKNKLIKMSFEHDTNGMEKKAGIFLASLIGAALIAGAGGSLYAWGQGSRRKPTTSGGSNSGSSGNKSDFGETLPKLKNLAVPASIGVGGYLLYKMLKDKEKKKLRFPEKINVDVPIDKMSSRKDEPFSMEALMDSPWDFIPWAAGGAMTLPAIYYVFQSLGESRKSKQYKRIQNKLDQLGTLSLPYDQQVEKMSSDSAESFLDELYDNNFEKKSSWASDLFDYMGVTDAWDFTKNKAFPGYGAILGLLAGGGYVLGDIAGKHFTYDPTSEKMKLEETYGDILGKIKKIPININPIEMKRTEEEKEEGEEKNKKRKKQRILSRSSDTINPDVNINDFLD